MPTTSYFVFWAEGSKIQHKFCETYYLAEALARETSGEVYSAESLGYDGAKYKCLRQFELKHGLPPNSLA